MDLNDEKTRPRATRLEDVGRRMDREIEELISWLNEELVPAVRGRSSRALRTAADKLAKFAEYMEQNQGKR